MYPVLTVLIGVLSSIMIAANGSLTGRWGAFPATVIVHAVGVLFAFLLCLLCGKAGKEDRAQLWARRPLWMYLGGPLGVLMIVFQNIAYSSISMTGVVALMLLGQTITSFLLDLMRSALGRKQGRPGNMLPGLLCALLGIWMLLDSSADGSGILAISLALGSGVVTIFSREVNAGLALQVGALRGSLVNHVTGLAAALVLAFMAGGPASFGNEACFPLAYLGGTFGVMIVLLYNMTVPRLSALQVTLLVFTGQIFTGFLCDLLGGRSVSSTSLYGGLIIACGILVNLLLDWRDIVVKRRKEAYFQRIKDVEKAHWESVLGRKNDP